MAIYQEQAEKIVKELDALECEQRHLEARVTAIRHRLQDQFGIQTWDYDGVKRQSKDTSHTVLPRTA